MHSYQTVIYTPAQLRKRLAYWQSRLRLDDWLITVEKRRAADMPDGDAAVASIEIERPNKVALITVLHERDYSPANVLPCDMEWSLVHELLHVHISGVKGEHAEHEFEYSLYEEQTIDSLAYAFIQLERGANI